MRLTYDATTDVAYLSLRSLAQGEFLGPTLLLETDPEFPGAVALDFSLTDGRVIGLEFQMASACLPAELLATAERRDGEGLADRFVERLARHIAGPGNGSVHPPEVRGPIEAGGRVRTGISGTGPEPSRGPTPQSPRDSTDRPTRWRSGSGKIPVERSHADERMLRRCPR